MNIGAMNVRITIQKQEPIVDKIGNHTNVWKDYFSCWATCSDSSGDEKDEAGETLQQDSMDITIRYSSETAALISTGYRVILNGQVYNIDHVDLMAFKHHSIKLHCSLARR